MTGPFFGIDASADSVAICAIDGAGNVIGEAQCAVSAPIVIEQLAALGANLEATVGIEAGGCGTTLTRRLRAVGYTVRVFDTRFANGFLKLTQNKTDRNDARGIAEIARLGGSAVPDILVKAEAIQLLRSELVLRTQLMSQRVALENAMQSVFRLNGGKVSRASSGVNLELVVQEELQHLRDEGCDIAELVLPVVTHLVALRQTLERSYRRLGHRAADLEVCKRFMDIPGVGCICALSFYTAIENPHRFERATDVGPYLGLVPRISQSGTVFRSGRISRMGNAMTRTNLVTAAGSLMRQANKDSDLRRWALSVAERAGRGKARVALARKLATVMLAMWKSGQSFQFNRGKAE
jgi:transposase